MIERFVRWLSRRCDRFLARRLELEWAGSQHDGCDSTCSFCGYLCPRCGRPE